MLTHACIDILVVGTCGFLQSSCMPPPACMPPHAGMNIFMLLLQFEHGGVSPTCVQHEICTHTHTHTLRSHLKSLCKIDHIIQDFQWLTSIFFFFFLIFLINYTYICLENWYSYEMMTFTSKYIYVFFFFYDRLVISS